LPIVQFDYFVTWWLPWELEDGLGLIWAFAGLI
jgi:hypothetical protein